MHVNSSIITAFGHFDDVIASDNLPEEPGESSSEDSQLDRSSAASCARYSHSWIFEPLLDHDAAHRISSSRVYRALLAVYLVVWFGVVAIAQTGGVAIAVICPVLSIALGTISLARVDRTLLRIVFKQFETWYMLIYTICFTIFGIWSMTFVHTAAHMVAYFGNVFIAALFIIIYDAELYSSFDTKLGVVIAGMALAVQVFLDNYLRSAFFQPVSFCFLFCTDTARMALAAITQNSFYHCKCFYNMVSNKIREARFLQSLISRSSISAVDLDRGEHRSFVTLRLPVLCLIEPHAASQPRSLQRQASSLLFTPWFNQTGSMPGFQSVIQPPRMVRVQAMPPAEFMGQSAFEAFDHDTQAQPSATAEHEQRGISRNFSFRPVNSVSWAIWFAHTQAYQVFMILYILFISIFGILSAVQDNGWYAVVYWPHFFVIFFELTRFDRTLFRMVFSRFEYWFVTISTIQAVVFGFWSQAGEGTHPAVLMMQLIGTAGLLVFIASMDASLTYPTWLKVSALSLGVLNSLRWMMSGSFTIAGTTSMAEREICLVFCSNTRVLAAFAFLNLAIFQLKYLIALYRHPKRCVIISAPLKYTITSERASRAIIPTFKQIGDGDVVELETVRPAAVIQHATASTFGDQTLRSSTLELDRSSVSLRESS